MEVIEQVATVLEACLVLAVDERDAGDDAGHSLRVGTVELAVLEVDVVDDLGDRRQAGVLEPEALDQDLEAAAVSFVAPSRWRRRQIFTRK